MALTPAQLEAFLLALDAGSPPGLLGDAYYGGLSSMANNSVISVLTYGADPTGLTDSTTAIQNALSVLNAGGDGILFFPNGAYVISATLKSTQPVTFAGVGKGIGPGAASANGGSVLEAAATFTTGNMVEFNVNTGCAVRDMQFNAAAVRTSGAAIAQTGQAGAVASGLVVERCAFLNQWDCVDLIQFNFGSIRDNAFEYWGNFAVYLKEANGLEAAGGFIENNLFNGNPTITASTYPGASVCIEAGYTTIRGNLMLGCLFGVLISLTSTTTVNAAAVIIAHNFIENQATAGVYARQQSGSATLTNFEVTDNEFSIISVNPATYQACVAIADAGSASWVELVTVADNRAYTVVTYASFIGFSINSGTVVNVHDNQIDNNSAVSTAIAFGSGGHAGVPMLFSDNQAKGFSAGKIYSVNSSTTIHDLTNFHLAANLPSVANGSIMISSDGTATGATNFALLGSGSGAVVQRLRGAWYSTCNLTG